MELKPRICEKRTAHSTVASSLVDPPFKNAYYACLPTTTSHLPAREGPSSWSLRSAAVMSASAPPERMPVVAPATPPPPALPAAPVFLPPPAAVPPPPSMTVPPRPASGELSAVLRARSAADNAWQLRTSKRASPPGVTRVLPHTSFRGEQRGGGGKRQGLGERNSKLIMEAGPLTQPLKVHIPLLPWLGLGWSMRTK